MRRKLVWALAFCGVASAVLCAAGTVTAQQFRDDGYGAAPGPYGGGYGGAPYGYDPNDAGPRRGPYQGAYNNDPDPGEPGYRPRAGQGRDRAAQDRVGGRQGYDQGPYTNDPDPGEPGYRPRGGRGQSARQDGAQDARRDFDPGNRGYGGYGGGPYGYRRDYGYGYDQGPAPSEAYGEREPGQTASDYDLGENANRTTVTEVANTTHQPPGTIVINTEERHLYLTQANGQALQYGIGVGREGFTWKGAAQVKRKSEWPAWIPPADMLKRRPDLPTRMEGGIENPLGARALYLFNGKGDTGYRIHGTNEPDTIGKAVSSGCIRMMNADVIDLYRRVPVGTKVVVL